MSENIKDSVEAAKERRKVADEKDSKSFIGWGISPKNTAESIQLGRVNETLKRIELLLLLDLENKS